MAAERAAPAPESAARPAVVCRGVGKTFGSGPAQVQALRGIDLDLACGELLLLMGPSGCGKTTLISVISAVLDHDAGQIAVYGRDLGALSASERTAFRAREVGFVFQAFNLIPALTALENASLPLLLAGTPRRTAERTAAALLDRVGLTPRAHARPSALSGGEQQRVAIARALVHGPRLIVCDEPTSALDHATGAAVMQLLHSAVHDPQHHDRAMIIVTHDERIVHHADRIVRMHDGRIVVSHSSPIVRTTA